MFGWLTKIAGPRVLLGVTLAGVVGMGILFWLYSNAANDAATARQQAAQLRETVQQERAAVERLEQERERLQAALTTTRHARQTARDRADGTRRELDELEDTDESVQDWADQHVPSAVADRLRQYARSGNPDGSGQDNATD